MMTDAPRAVSGRQKLRTMNNEKKTCKVVLISNYFGRELTIRIDADKAARLMSKESPMAEINYDLDLIHCGYAGKYLSKGQARKIKNYNPDMDYFYKAVIK